MGWGGGENSCLEFTSVTPKLMLCAGKRFTSTSCSPVSGKAFSITEDRSYGQTWNTICWPPIFANVLGPQEIISITSLNPWVVPKQSAQVTRLATERCHWSWGSLYQRSHEESGLGPYAGRLRFNFLDPNGWCDLGQVDSLALWTSVSKSLVR